MTIDIEKLPSTRAEAAALGLTHYFTGKPCKHGHIRPRTVSGRSCVECANAAARRWSKNNPDKETAKTARWAAANKWSKTARDKRYREAHPERIKEKSRRCYLSLPPGHGAEASRKHRQNNPESAKAAARRWRLANRPIKAAESQRRRARKKNATIPLFPVTAEAIEERLALTDGCCYCGQDKPLEIEHVVALNDGGWHIPSNILGACRSCNGSKGDRPAEEWFRAQPFFSEDRWQKIQELTQ